MQQTLPSNIDLAKIFVGGLSWQTTEASLQAHFQNYGTVLSVEVMRDRNTGDPRGFAFVVFDNDETVDAIMKTRHEIDNKVVDVKRAQARGTAPPSIHPKNMLSQRSKNKSEGGDDSSVDVVDNTTNNKIFVGGLPLHVDKEALSNHFSKFGTVTDAVVMMDPTHTRSRGFGFVTFEMGSNSAQQAMADQPHTMHGKFVEIKLAQPKEASSNNAKVQVQRMMMMNNDKAENGLVCSEFFGLAAAYARNGWKAGYGSKAFGNAGWRVRDWDDGGDAPERNGFSFQMLEERDGRKDDEDMGREAKRLKPTL